MRFVKFDNIVIFPIKMHSDDAGYDLVLPEKIYIQAHTCKVIDLKIGVKLNKNECGIICLRSSIAKKNLIANTSPIDAGYTGPIHLILHNLSDNTLVFDANTRICQLVIFKIPYERGNNKIRNDNNFGSTGR